MDESRPALPEELEVMAPGPKPAALLDSVDRRTLSGADRLRLARARNRLASYVQARLLEDIYAVSWDEPPVAGEVRPEQASRYPWAETELAFAMRWTRTAAGGRLEQARELIEDLPAVQQALLAGEIDMPDELPIAPPTAGSTGTTAAAADDRWTRDCMDTVKACILVPCGKHLDCLVR